MQEKNEVQVVNNDLQQPRQTSNEYTNVFGSKDLFEHTQRIALMFSKSELVPPQFKGNVGNCIIALEMAGRVGASPLMVMQSLYIVHGKPAWSSTFLIATINACGKFSPLRYKENAEKTTCFAWAYDKATNEVLEGVEVTMAIAKAEGWIDKAGSKWKTMPQLMLRYRAATFFARQFAPEISMGIHTQEEIEDIGYTEVRPTGGSQTITSEVLKNILPPMEEEEKSRPSPVPDPAIQSNTDFFNQEADRQQAAVKSKSGKAKKEVKEEQMPDDIFAAINDNRQIDQK